MEEERAKERKQPGQSSKRVHRENRNIKKSLFLIYLDCSAITVYDTIELMIHPTFSAVERLVQ